MDIKQETTIRSQLLSRRERLKLFISEERASQQLVDLLKEVEAALERLDNGEYGICELCKEEIESEYLHAEPLVRVCLSHLSDTQQRAIERDLQLAAQIQGKLLPTCNTRMSGWEVCYHYEPHGALGGDYCDIVDMHEKDGCIYFFFGDVSGKGVAASLLVSYLHATFRSLLSTGLPMKELIEKANRLFCDSTLSSNFVTLVCGKVSVAGEIELCNAGHCFPLIVQSGQIRSIESTGLPLGMFYTAEYKMRKVQLAKGDFIVLYTDGITESRNQADEEYSEARLSALVAKETMSSPEDLIRKAMEDLLLFREGVPRADDVTIMALRRIE